MKWIDCKQKLPQKNQVVIVAHWMNGGGLFAEEVKGWHSWIALYSDGWKRADGLSEDKVFHGNVKFWQTWPAPPVAPPITQKEEK